jgi:beta-xylosidase
MTITRMASVLVGTWVLLAQQAPGTFLTEPLVKGIYTADPSAHVFGGRIYIYPSHDIDAGVPADDLGSHFAMRDYYLYFPVKDKQDAFRIGVGVANTPAGPFTAQPEPIKGSFSIDPAVFRDTDGKYYMYFGGIWGGQLQRWATGTYTAKDVYPPNDRPALTAKIARLGDDMVSFAEAPRDIVLQDEQGKPLLAGDNGRRFFEASWMHKYNGTYYFSYSTGDTHFIMYATGKSPYGPFTIRGKVLEPVLGWTNHHSIVEFKGKWYLFYHDAQLSNGQTHLRNIKVTELKHRPDGSIETVVAYKK